MKNTFWLTTIFLTIILPLTTTSCLTGKMTPKKSFAKEIKTEIALEKGQIIFENEVAIIRFDKTEVLGILEKEIKTKNINKCHEKRLSRYINQVKNLNTETNIFPDLGNIIKTSDNFEISFQRNLIKNLVLHYRIAVFNKSKKEFEKKIVYRKKPTEGYCCMTNIEFIDGQKILDTDLFTDFIVIEECEE